MTPPTLRIQPVVSVIVISAPRVTAPVPMVKVLVPPQVNEAFQTWTLLLVKVIALAVLLLIVPPLIVSVPVPMAVAVLMLSVPAFNVVPPV